MNDTLSLCGYAWLVVYYIQISKRPNYIVWETRDKARQENQLFIPHKLDETSLKKVCSKIQESLFAGTRSTELFILTVELYRL